MSASFDFNDFKKRLSKLVKSSHKKIAYMRALVAKDGAQGLIHWFKSQSQLEQLDEAIADLINDSQADDFTLLRVATTIKSFQLLDEDLGQAEWYETAHNLLQEYDTTLIEKKFCDLKKLQLASKELRFISDADEFHQRYQLQPIQQKVKIMYQDIEKHISEFKALEKEKIALKTEQDKVKTLELEKQKAEAEAKKASMENLKIKEKRLAIIEEKKKRLAEKELAEQKHTHELELAEKNAKQAEIQRQEKLQDAYVELQLEEKLSNWTTQDLAKFMLKKISDSSLDEEKQQSLTILLEEILND